MGDVRSHTADPAPGAGQELPLRWERMSGRPMARPSSRSRWLPWVLMAALWSQGVLGAPAAANSLVHERDLLFGPAAAAALVDVTGDGAPELVLAGEQGVGVLAVPGHDHGGFKDPLALLPPLPSPPTAIGGGDLTGDGVPELVVGTGNAGAVYVFGWAGHRWTLLGQTPYMWSPVRALHGADLDGDGRDELVVLAGSGELVVLAWKDRAWHVLWRSPAGWSPVLHVHPADLTGEGRPQLVVADQAGAVAVWRWPLVEPLAQGFVWGTPVSMAVELRETGPPQLLITTTERLLYRFLWQDEQLLPVGTPIFDERLPFDALQPVRWPGEPRASLASLYAGGLGLWRVSGSSLELLADGRPQGPRWLLADGAGERIIVGEDAHPASLWERRPANFLRLTFNGAPAPLQDAPVFQDDHVLLSLRDWANILGLTLYWDSERQRLTAVGPRGFVILTMGNPESWSHLGIRPLSAAPLLRSGRTYAPPDVALLFGAAVQWDPRRRELVLTLPD